MQNHVVQWEQNDVTTSAGKIGIALGAIHLVLYIALLCYVAVDTEAQAPLIGIYFLFADLPISLLDFLQTHAYSLWLGRVSADSSLLRYVLFIPNFVHAVLGTAWWYFIPRLLLPRRLGGVWGQKFER